MLKILASQVHLKLKKNGNFIIRGLNQDDYKIKIEHIDYINYESGIISVVVGEVSDTGTIELIVPVSQAHIKNKN